VVGVESRGVGSLRGGRWCLLRNRRGAGKETLRSSHLCCQSGAQCALLLESAGRGALALLGGFQGSLDVGDGRHQPGAAEIQAASATSGRVAENPGGGCLARWVDDVRPVRAPGDSG
jgi:hypothetical protein